MFCCFYGGYAETKLIFLYHYDCRSEIWRWSILYYLCNTISPKPILGLPPPILHPNAPILLRFSRPHASSRSLFLPSPRLSGTRVSRDGWRKARSIPPPPPPPARPALLPPAHPQLDPSSARLLRSAPPSPGSSATAPPPLGPSSIRRRLTRSVLLHPPVPRPLRPPPSAGASPAPSSSFARRSLLSSAPSLAARGRSGRRHLSGRTAEQRAGG